jgi:hypothetical protein
MKKQILYLIASVVLLASCQKEVIDTDINRNVWPNGAGDYAPYTIGSTFKYEYVSTNPAFVDTVTLTVIKDTIINNLVYHYLHSDKPNLVAPYFSNINNGSITEITYNMNFLGLIVIPVLNENTMRVNAEIGSKWYDADLALDWSGIPVTATFEHTFMQRSFYKELFGKTYDSPVWGRDIIGVTLPAGVSFPPGVPSVFQFDNCYAKGAGLIQRNVSIGTTQKLISYSIAGK